MTRYHVRLSGLTVFTPVDWVWTTSGNTFSISCAITPSYSVGNSIVYKLYGKSESAAGEVTITGQGVEDVMILQEVAA